MSSKQLLRSRACPCLLRAPKIRKNPLLTLRSEFNCSNSPRCPFSLNITTRNYGTKLFHHPKSPPTVQGRWYSGGGASGRGGASGGSGGGRKGFFQNFIENIRKGLNQNREMQESLKGFHEEREKLQKSYILQQAKEKAAEATSKVFEYGTKGVEMTKQSYTQVKEGTAKVWF